ncbi:hypothetical protein ACH5RR_032226, partial [Cinchona calisaya]
IKVVVVHAFPTKERRIGNSTTRDFVVVNEEKKNMLLTMWNEFEDIDGTKLADTIATVPLIIAMRIK